MDSRGFASLVDMTKHTYAQRLAAIVAAGFLALTGIVLIPSSASALVSVPTNVGVPSGTTLTLHAGDQTITTANTVIDGWDITGKLIIDAANVQVRRTKVRSTGVVGNGIEVKNPHGGITPSASISRVTVTGFENSVYGGNLVVTNLDVSGMGSDGFQIFSNSTVQGSYCHGGAYVSGAHADCLQIFTGVVNATIRSNYLDAGSGGSSALFIAPDLGPNSAGPVTVSGNYFNGGGWTVQSVQGTDPVSGVHYKIADIEWVDNRYGNTHAYGYENITADGLSFYDYPTNVRDDTGAGV